MFTAKVSDRGNSTKRRKLLAKIKRHPKPSLGVTKLCSQVTEIDLFIYGCDNINITGFFLTYYFFHVFLSRFLFLSLSTPIVKDPYIFFSNVTEQMLFNRRDIYTLICYSYISYYFNPQGEIENFVRESREILLMVFSGQVHSLVGSPYLQQQARTEKLIKSAINFRLLWSTVALDRSAISSGYEKRPCRRTRSRRYCATR